MGLFNAFKTVFKPASRVDVRARFELLRTAISGTMSKFYMAHDRESDRVVGLKILDRQKLAAFERRFRGIEKPSEGEIVTSLNHPNIVDAYEYGMTTKGEQYLVMEFIEGPGLNSLLIAHNDDTLSGIRVALIRQIAEALAAVHKAKFIHRDVCPRNVMIEPKNGILKLIDFGLTVPATAHFMAPGNRTGTPNYMAPELVKRLQTDSRLDVFAFGITAYEICTYQLPWERGSTGQAAMSHTSRSATDIREYRPQINRRLAKAIHHCLKRKPDDRCPSMEHFLRSIRKVEHEDES